MTTLVTNTIVDLESTNAETAIVSLCRAVFDDYPNSTTTVTALTGGTTNKLFKVKGMRKQSENIKVLVRVFGEATIGLIDRDVENYYLVHIQENYKGMVPEIYCRFGNGMIYEYFEGRTLQAIELPQHIDGVAQHLAKWHSMDIKPFDVEQGYKPVLVHKMFDWLEQTRLLSYENLPMTFKQLEDEMNLLKNIIEKNSFPVRFCHNDLPSLNVILDERYNSIHFIDYEYCSYNYRGFDIGNHFNEFAGLDLKTEQYPTVEQQRQFARSYLSTTSDSVSEQDVENLVNEANLFALGSHLLWAAWGLIQASASKIDFDYIGYSRKRMEWYLAQKESHLSKIENK
jgi:ethanolamine kinase